MQHESNQVHDDKLLLAIVDARQTSADTFSALIADERKQADENQARSREDLSEAEKQKIASDEVARAAAKAANAPISRKPFLGEVSYIDVHVSAPKLKSLLRDVPDDAKARKLGFDIINLLREKRAEVRLTGMFSTPPADSYLQPTQSTRVVLGMNQKTHQKLAIDALKMLADPARATAALEKTEEQYQQQLNDMNGDVASLMADIVKKAGFTKSDRSLSGLTGIISETAETNPAFAERLAEIAEQMKTQERGVAALKLSSQQAKGQPGNFSR